MSVPEFFSAIEQTEFSVWIRESESLFAYYFILVFHTIGLGILVGSCALVCLRLLGVVPALPLQPLTRLYRLIWIGLGLNIVSGILLLYAYPTKALTNPLFYLKLALIGVAVWTMVRIKRKALEDPDRVKPEVMATARRLAAWSLILWFSVVTMGRLLAYTSSYILYGKIM